MPYTATLNAVTAGHDPPIVLQAITGVGQTARKARVAVPAGGHVATGPDVGEPADITCDIAISTPEDPDAALAWCDLLTAAWAPTSVITEMTLTITATWQRNRRGRPVSIDTDLALVSRGVIIARAVFDAFDPLWYGTERSVIVAVGGTGGGVVSPIESPVVSIAGANPGDAVITNAGTAPAEWTASLTGGTNGVTTPRLMLEGQVVEINGTIPAGSVLFVDSRERMVLLDGNPRSWVTYASTWWKVPPGQSTFSYRAVEGDGVANLMWRDAYH